MVYREKIWYEAIHLINNFHAIFIVGCGAKKIVNDLLDKG
jgi:hypothetical protein